MQSSPAITVAQDVALPRSKRRDAKRLKMPLPISKGRRLHPMPPHLSSKAVARDTPIPHRKDVTSGRVHIGKNPTRPSRTMYPRLPAAPPPLHCGLPLIHTIKKDADHVYRGQPSALRLDLCRTYSSQIRRDQTARMANHDRADQRGNGITSPIDCPATSPDQAGDPPRKLGVVAVVVERGRFLVIRRSTHVTAPGTLCFPGGAIESGETDRGALIREMKEELDLAVRPVAHLWTCQTAARGTLCGGSRLLSITTDHARTRQKSQRSIG